MSIRCRNISAVCLCAATSLSAAAGAVNRPDLFLKVGAQKPVNLPFRSANVDEFPHPSAELYTEPVFFIAEEGASRRTLEAALPAASTPAMHAGATAVSAATQLCTNLNETFDMRAYDTGSGDTSSYAAVGIAAACQRDLQVLLREQRGLAMLHEPSYAAAVLDLESALAKNSYFAAEFEVSVWRKPFRAQALRRLASVALGASGQRTYCEVGFGAGHSALLILAAFRTATVISYDLGLAPVTMAAHDFLDERYPERLFLTAGDSYLTLPRMRDYFQAITCDLIYLDGSTLYASVAADVHAWAHVAGPLTVVAAAAARKGSDVDRAWRDLVETGVLTWEGSMYETPGVPETDVIVYGHYANVTHTVAMSALNGA